MTFLLALALSIQVDEGSWERIHAMVRPEAGTVPWADLAWMDDVSKARERGAKEGKPLLLWAAGGGGHPLGLC